MKTEYSLVVAAASKAKKKKAFFILVLRLQAAKYACIALKQFFGIIFLIFALYAVTVAQ